MLNYIIFVIALLALVSSFLVNFIQKFRKPLRAGDEAESDGADQSFDGKGHIWSKRDSARRKAIYKRNSQLNDYLERNLSKGGTNDNVQFQSSFPWKTYVQNSRYQSKIQALDQVELKLFESIFEIILTEKSYLSQLEHLNSFSESHPELDQAISKYDRNLLFGNIRQLFAVNHELYYEFESSFQSDIFMGKIFPILSKYLTNGSLEPYIDYIKGHQERNRLLNDETNCETVPDLVKLRSLIIVPMQRVTRYPLLVQNILSVADKILSKSVNSPVSKQIDRSSIEKCLQDASKFAGKCNKALDDERKLFDLIQFKKQLTGGVTIDDLVAPNREILSKTLVKMYFLKQGGGTVAIPASKGSSGVFKSYSSSSMSKVKSTLILLTDMLILTEHKPKKNQYIVIDYDRLNQIQFDRRRDSIISTTGSTGSNESIEKVATDDGNSATSNKARCTLLLRSNDNIYGITFFTTEDEDKFVKQFQQKQTELQTRSNTNGKQVNGF